MSSPEVDPKEAASSHLVSRWIIVYHDSVGSGQRSSRMDGCGSQMDNPIVLDGFRSGALRADRCSSQAKERSLKALHHALQAVPTCYLGFHVSAEPVGHCRVLDQIHRCFSE